MQDFMQNWGYWAVLAGTTVEGEVAYLSCIMASAFGHLKLSGVVFVSMLGAILRDSTIFLTSRYAASQLPSSWTNQNRIEKVSRWMERRPPLFLLFYRFYYGISGIIVLTLGISNISLKRYFTICILGSVLWALVYGILGYCLASQVLALVEMEGKTIWMVLILIFILVLFIFIRKFRITKNV